MSSIILFTNAWVCILVRQRLRSLQHATRGLSQQARHRQSHHDASLRACGSAKKSAKDYIILAGSHNIINLKEFF